VGSAPPPVPAADRASAIVALWFGQPDRPVLWMEEGRPDDVTRYLWGLLWPEARRRFAFCTFALQVRHVRKRPFDFLALPPSARGSFHERARSGAWWREGEAASSELTKRASDAWVQDVLARGAEATWAMPRFCEVHGLPALDDAALPAFHRFADLEEPARVRLTAARARADLLERLWPEIPATHGVARAVLEELLRHQADAPMSPRPFWDLDDLLKRRIVRQAVEAGGYEPSARGLPDVAAFYALAASDPLVDPIQRTLENEVRRRFALAGADGVPGLTALLLRQPVPRFRAAILGGVHSALADVPDDEASDAKAAALVSGAVLPDVTEAVLGALAPERRVRVALRARSDLAPEGLAAFDDHVLTTASRLGDAMLAAEVWLAQGRPVDAVRAAARIVAARPDVVPERMAPIVARLDAATSLAWALAVTEGPLSAWAGERGAEAAVTLGLALPELVQRCAAAPNGGAVLLARFARLPPSELRGALGDMGMVVRMLALALVEGSSRMDLVVHAVTEALEDRVLFGPQVAVALAGAPSSLAAARFAEELAPRLVRGLAGGRWPAEQRALWLGIAPVREALERLPPAMLFGAKGTRDWDADCLPNVARACADQVRSDVAVTLGWVANLLDRPLAGAGSRSVDRARSDLETLLSVPPERQGWLRLAAQILWAVRRTDFKSAQGLVERAFPVLYAELVRDAPGSPVRTVLAQASYHWDVAKTWRHWILDAWTDHEWPPASFLRCMNGDEALFLRIAHRARWQWRGREFLHRIAASLDEDAALAAKWREPVDRALGFGSLGVDYD
jgi:hypothetical protein